ncbi:hypothetical protein BC830DRAFT_1169118 [Chytriomyces sp. MP71]|nr:hypothetical protein BC830DRAFT_1169118 [Chytriomyces sp. MP71]
MKSVHSLCMLALAFAGAASAQHAALPVALAPRPQPVAGAVADDGLSQSHHPQLAAAIQGLHAAVAAGSKHEDSSSPIEAPKFAGLRAALAVALDAQSASPQKDQAQPIANWDTQDSFAETPVAALAQPVANWNTEDSLDEGVVAEFAEPVANWDAVASVDEEPVAEFAQPVANWDTQDSMDEQPVAKAAQPIANWENEASVQEEARIGDTNAPNTNPMDATLHFAQFAKAMAGDKDLKAQEPQPIDAHAVTGWKSFKDAAKSQFAHLKSAAGDHFISYTSFKKSAAGTFAALSNTTIVTTANSTINTIEDTVTGKLPLTVTTGVIGGISMLVGLGLVFAGNRVFKPLLFLTGFGTLALVDYYVLGSINAGRDANSQIADWVFIVSAILSGLLGGFLFVFLWKVGLFFLGAGLGFCLAALIAFALQNVWHNSTAKYIFLGVLALIGGIAILFFEVPVLVLSTSVIGAYWSFVGLDVFVRTGFFGVVVSISHGDVTVFTTTNSWVWMLIGCLVLALVGVAVQWHEIRRHGGHRGLQQRDLQNGARHPVGMTQPVAMPSSYGYQKV